MRVRLDWIPPGLLLLCGLASTGAAQNVSDYGSIDRPYVHLFLLREPAVWDDLQLEPRQRVELRRLNDRIDGPLLALRNWPNEKANQKLSELIDETRSGVREILQQEQRDRLEQIVLQIRGIAVVLADDVAARLDITSTQRQAIEEILTAARDELAALREQLQAGASPQDTQRQATLVQERHRRRVLAELTDKQQRRLAAELFGRSFDTSGLGRVRFKAPEFAADGVWINSGPPRLRQIRGRVVAVHFWAFGCVNCQRNFPAYRAWHDAFAGRGLVIVGIHTPETAAEHSVDSLRRKVKEAGFTFPVLVDNEKRNWNAWGNSMWPSVYLVDKEGYLRYWWYGELNWRRAGGQQIMGKRIEELLGE